MPLIVVDSFSTEGPKAGQGITFVVAQELAVNGQTLAKPGEVALGQVSQVSSAKASGEPMSVAMQQVSLTVGTVKVPLRSSEVRGFFNPVQFQERPESGKVEVTLFVAEDVPFPENP